MLSGIAGYAVDVLRINQPVPVILSSQGQLIPGGCMEAHSVEAFDNVRRSAVTWNVYRVLLEDPMILIPAEPADEASDSQLP